MGSMPTVSSEACGRMKNCARPADWQDRRRHPPDQRAVQGGRGVFLRIQPFPTPSLSPDGSTGGPRKPDGCPPRRPCRPLRQRAVAPRARQVLTRPVRERRLLEQRVLARRILLPRASPPDACGRGCRAPPSKDPIPARSRLTRKLSPPPRLARRRQAGPSGGDRSRLSAQALVLKAAKAARLTIS